MITEITAAALLAATLAAGSAPPASLAAHRNDTPTAMRIDIREAATIAARDASRLTQPASRAAAAATRSKRGATEVVIGGLVGGFLGLAGGGYAGYHIERGITECRCDDPGIRGLLWGAPIGALAGAILGGKFLFR